MKSIKSLLIIVSFIALFISSSFKVSATEFVVYDATRDFTESDKGFLNFQFKSSSPPNWISPKNYFEGEWYFRYEVIGIPTNTTYKLSTCIWADWNWPTSWNETCHDATAALNGKGVYLHNSSPSDWWKKGGVGVNFAKPYNIKELGVVLWGTNSGGNCNVTPYNVGNGCNYLAPKLMPMKIRVTIVAVSEGSTFSGWSNYGLSGGTPPPPPTSGTAPSITKHPSSVTVNAGQKATFSVSATGTSPLSYQWKKNGSNISGASGSSYTTPTLSTSNNGDLYSCKVLNSKGSSTSNQAKLTVNSSSSPPPPSDEESTTRIEVENNYSKVSDVGSNGSIGVQSSSINSNGKAVSIPDKGDKINVAFKITETGNQTIRVWLRSGNKTNKTSYFNSGYSYKFKVSGIGNVNFVGNASSIKGPYNAWGGSHWGFMEATVNFTSTGNKTLEISADYVWQAVDYIEIVGGGSSSPDPTPTPPPPSGGSTTKIEVENAYSKVSDVGSNGTIGTRSFSINSNGKAVSVPDKGDKIKIAFKINNTGSYKIRVWVRSGNATYKTSYFNSGYSYLFSISGIGNVNFVGNAGSVKGPFSEWGGSHWGFMDATVNFTSTGTKYLEVKAQHVWQAVDYILIEGGSSSAARIADNSTFENNIVEANSLKQNISVYPNPVDDTKIVKILMPERSSEPIETKIYSLHGSLLMQKEIILGLNESSFELDLSNVINKNGFYILRVSQGNNESKMIKLVYK